MNSSVGTRKLIVVGKLKTCVGVVILEISIGVEIIFGVPVVNSIFCKLFIKSFLFLFLCYECYQKDRCYKNTCLICFKIGLHGFAIF